jgi:hypothetical protein
MRYRLRINDTEYPVTSSQELQQLLDSVKERSHAYMELTQIHEPDRKPKFATRLLARVMKWDLNILNQEDEILAWVNGPLAVLLYSENREGAFHSYNPDHTLSLNNKVEFYAIDGSLSEHPGEWVIPTEQAIEALLRFYTEGEKPTNTQWRKLESDLT